MEVDFLNNAKLAYFLDNIKKIFSLKRTKFTLYMAAVLWLAVATQMVVNKVFHEDFKITEAFEKTNAEEKQSGIEVVAEYNSEFLSESDKKEIIQKLADAIGLKIDSDVAVWQEGNRCEYSYAKKAKQAESEIKVVSLGEEQENNAEIEMKHYIIVRLSIYEGIQSIDRYKNIIEDTLAKLGVDYKEVTMKFEGKYDGNLSLAEKNQIASNLVKELKGEIALEYDEGDLYTVYAYTGLLNEYIVSDGSKVNIQIAITYNELTNKSTVTLATPILNESW
jgi:hypothetical protein